LPPWHGRSLIELSSQAPGRQIQFVIQSMPPAHGDKTLIRQVLVNVLANAIKFSRTRDEALIEFGYRGDTDSGAYYVKDNGVGFDMRYGGKLFGVFQRLHSEAEFEGTGVGLALVYRIVERHADASGQSPRSVRERRSILQLPTGQSK